MAYLMKSPAVPTDSQKSDCAVFEILGHEGLERAIVGTGNPATDTIGRPCRVVYVEIIDPDTGQTWLGATGDWERRAGVWHWIMHFSSIVDTMNGNDPFNLPDRDVWAVACYDEAEKLHGPKKTKSTAPFVLGWPASRHEKHRVVRDVHHPRHDLSRTPHQRFEMDCADSFVFSRIVA